MTIPTQIEVDEFKKLYEEFKLTPEGKHPRYQDLQSFSILAPTISDPIVKEVFNKCVRYNRYLELRALLAPHMYAKLCINGIEI